MPIPASAADSSRPAGTVAKDDYNLLHPTPPDYLREMVTDRPDKTESPVTVDAGHFQLEMDLVSYSQDVDRSGGGNTRSQAWAIAPLNLKAGLLNNVDFQVLLDTYNSVQTDDRAAGKRERLSGFGDVTTRVKINLWGNDGGRTAFAIMPFAKFPVNQDHLGNNVVEGGIILPLAIDLGAGWDMGLMTEVDFLQNSLGENYHVSTVNSVTFGHSLAGRLAGYAEFFSEVSAQHGASWVGTADFGLTYGLTDNIQFDAGLNVGVTRSADDLNPFVGFSWRF